MKKITSLFVILMAAVITNVSAAVLPTPTVGTGTATTRGFTATWTAVANATSYNVTTYLDGTTTVVSTTNVTGATAATASVVNLVAATAYQFTVTAVGDGVTYTNSPESSKSTTITTLTPVLSTPSAPSAATRITYTGFTANFSPVAGATTYDVRVYNESLVQVGSTVTVTPTGTTTLSAPVNATGGLLVPNTTYTYTVSACDGNTTPVSFNSPESSQSVSFTTLALTGSYTLQYAASDAATLFADLKGGAADIFELTTSGGLYEFVSTNSNNAILIRNTTVRAAIGLAAKPILKLNSTNTGTTVNIFYTLTPNLTIRFDGLEFDGVNLGSGGYQPLAFHTSTAAINLKLYVTNCYFHDFKNATGNGVIRWDGVPTNSTSQYIDIQRSVFNACSGRMIYSNPASGASNITLKNNTFSNNLLFNTRATIIYNNQSNPGTIVVDHCTFYNIITSGTDNIVRNSSGYGPMSFTNSIFVTVAQSLPSTNTTKDYCYLAGFATVPTGTNTFAAATPPTFTNSTTVPLNFSLTNKSSFICGDGYVAGNTYMLGTPDVITGGTSITSTGFTANWVPVSGSSSYDVKVYDATPTQVGSTVNVSAVTFSTPISGLSANTPYTYTVTAKGDNAIYFDSAPSTPKAVTTSVATSINSLNVNSIITVSGKTIITSATGNLEVFNMQGAKLIDAKITNSINTNLPKGLYITRFKSSDNQITIQKIILN